MQRDGKPSVSVPVHANRDIAKGTLRGILDDVGLSDDEFAGLL
jgi:predicted RNA binding protein YcfA (HicA-like mRNA interferase family)